ncbi:MAG TPA: hypothetical protein VN845_02185 [Solirubrobacteraceae bacterium]|nr:hypothetical protein [Solirubrobacteraceae bacterium]
MTVAEIALVDDPDRWQALGFAVSGGTLLLGAVRVALTSRAAGRGILGWSLCDLTSTQLDGLPTVASDASVLRAEAPPTAPTEEPPHTSEPRHAEAPGAQIATPMHPNGIAAIDHVVAMSPQLDRSVRALQAAGLDLRRIREQPTPAGAPRQAFFRLGEVILELVQEPEEVVAERPDGSDGPARFWGLALLSDDLDRTVEHLGPYSSEIRAAVQPGRRIATLRRSAGLAIPVAVMSRDVT